MKRNIETYTIERIRAADLSPEIVTFMMAATEKLNAMYGTSHKKIPLLIFARDHYLAICRRNGKIVGFMVATLGSSVFDSDVKILRQESLYALPKTRAAKYLLADFIDFGKSNADHILTMIAENTNIKPRSLERLGFRQLEVLYRMET